MKLLIPGLLLAAAIAAVAWVLVPSGTPDTVASPRKPAAASGKTNPTDTPDAPDAPSRPAGGAELARPVGTGKGAEALAAARAEVARANAAAVQAGGLGAIAAAAIEPDELPAPPGGPSKWGRQGRDAQRANPKQVKDAVRAYYANLPKSGAIPATVRLEEILPLAVIDEMNLPPGGRVIELGHYPIGDRQAFDHVLLQPDDTSGALGVTVITPEGERVREYVFYPVPTAEPTDP